MKRQLDEGVVNLRATLQAQLDLATNRLKKVEVMKDEPARRPSNADLTPRTTWTRSASSKRIRICCKR
jgi:hypothetical protein